MENSVTSATDEYKALL